MVQTRKPWPGAWARQASSALRGTPEGAEQSWADQRSPLEPGSWPSLTPLTLLMGARTWWGEREEAFDIKTYWGSWMRFLHKTCPLTCSPSSQQGSHCPNWEGQWDGQPCRRSNLHGSPHLPKQNVVTKHPRVFSFKQKKSCRKIRHSLQVKCERLPRPLWV